MRKFKRRYSDNVADRKPPYKRRKIKLSVSIDEGTEEQLAVYCAFQSDRDWSDVVNVALYEFFQREDVEPQLEKAYEWWKKNHP